MNRAKGEQEEREDQEARRKKLARIHILQRELAMDDDAYRAIVRQFGTTDSAGDLDGEGRERLIRTLARIKGLAAGKAHVGQRLIETHIKHGGLQLTQIEYIRVLWDKLHRISALHDPSERALNAFVRRQTGIERVEWLLDARQCNRVIEALKSWAQRAEKKGNGKSEG